MGSIFPREVCSWDAILTAIQSYLGSASSATPEIQFLTFREMTRVSE
jgi:hypothetical protein